MNNFRITLRVCALAISLLGFSSIGLAQAPQTWVSGVGDDANPCTRTAPCRTFAGAISKTATGGNISTIDSGGFGMVVITKSITIDGTGSMASIIALANSGISINITNPSDAAKSVRIRGLSINGQGKGLTGINVIAANSVSVEDTVIDGFTGVGVAVAAGLAYIENSTIRNNGDVGVAITGTGKAGLNDVFIVFNGTSVAGTPTAFNNVVMYGNKGGPATKQ
jgi:hypothetical protein